MSVSMYVEGIREPDDRWRQMKAVYDACISAGIGPPEEVQTFFNDEAPDDAGIKIPLSWGGDQITHGWVSDNAEGLELDVADLPPQITKLRFYLS